MLTIIYDNSDKDVPCICVMKAEECLRYVCLKMELGEQAELLYRALTEQDFKIKEKNDSIKTVTNAKEAEEYQIRPKGDEVSWINTDNVESEPQESGIKFKNCKTCGQKCAIKYHGCSNWKASEK